MSDAFCLSENELELWPKLPKDRAIHHRGCNKCNERISKLVRPDFVWAAERSGRVRGLSAQEILDRDVANLNIQRTSNGFEPDDAA